MPKREIQFFFEKEKNEKKSRGEKVQNFIIEGSGGFEVFESLNWIFSFKLGIF